MTEDQKPDWPRRRLVDHHHRKRPLRYWVMSLLVILAIIIFLPRLIALLE